MDVDVQKRTSLPESTVLTQFSKAHLRVEWAAIFAIVAIEADFPSEGTQLWFIASTS